MPDEAKHSSKLAPSGQAHETDAPGTHAFASTAWHSVADEDGLPPLLPLEDSLTVFTDDPPLATSLPPAPKSSW